MRPDNVSCMLGGHNRVNDGDGFWHCEACGQGRRRAIVIPPSRPHPVSRHAGPIALLAILAAVVLGLLVAMAMDGCAHQVGMVVGGG